MKKREWVLVASVAAILIVGGSVFIWRNGQPRRESLAVVVKLSSALTGSRGSELLDAVLLPDAIRDKTVAEQQGFLTKVLTDEISPEGVRNLRQHAEFGPLKSIFPDEAGGWCATAGVLAVDCVAFKMERAGIRAEVVLVREGTTYRVVRCNNVKQMAGA